MADEEKTEEPTSKKIEDARLEGNVPKSQDTSSFVTLFVAVAVLLLMIFWIRKSVIGLYLYYQSFIGVELTQNSVFEIFLITIREVLLMFLPISIAVAIAGVLAALMQFGLLFSAKPLTPDIKKIDPIKGLKNLFSLKKLIEAIKTIAKVFAVFALAFYVLLSFIKELPHTVFLPVVNQLAWLKEKMIILAAIMLVLLLVVALIDLLIVRYQYFKDLRMSKQEIKDEYKQMEGDPQVKARIRRVQAEMSQKRMMQEVPQADVVITNPTHYAVAIRYEQGKDVAPLVIAKGTDLLALRIKEIALNHNVQIVENPPLARELYKLCKIDQAIPRNLYQAVAEVLAFVYQQKDKK